MQKMTAVVLAAGLGKRMKSQLPKVLHPVCGKTMVEHVVDAAFAAGAAEVVVVVGHGADKVREVLGDRVFYAVQNEQLGTGHALMCAREYVTGDQVMVLCGDAPLLEPGTLSGIAEEHLRAGADATVLTAVVENPTRYGRIVRDSAGFVSRIVEEGDATPEERRICEINTGTYCFNRRVFELLEGAGRSNAQGEYYITDAVDLFRRNGGKVAAVILEDPSEAEAPNDRVQLAATAALMQQRILERLMLAGVTVVDPRNTYVEAGISVGPDSVLLPGTVLQGRTVIGSGCTVGPYTQMRHVTLGDRVSAQYSVLVESIIEDDVTIGPFAYLRPGAHVKKSAKIGDFVEIKKSTVGEGSKVPHLSYIGDATIGRKVNIGAGTITCNYDGEKKNPTIIGDEVFIGSNSSLVAPVRIEEKAYVAAGSTITQDVPPGALAFGRARQSVKENYRKRRDG